MSAIHASFEGLSETEFDTYAAELVDKSVSAQRRKQALAYLQQTASSDKGILDAERAAMNTRRVAHRKKQNTINALLSSHDFDFTRDAALFQVEATTNTELATLLQQDNQELFIKNRQITGDLVVAGNNVTIDGQSNGKAATQNKLVNTASVTGTLTISGNNCTVKGIDFTSTGEKAIVFSGDCQNCTLVSCKFTAGAGIPDSKWWYGEGFGGGSLTIRNCRVEGFQSWYLMDATTTSAAATDNLKRFKLKDCFFKNNLGSIAIRGMVTKPIKSAIVTGNTWETDTLHSSFWDFCEVSGGVAYVEISGNSMTGPVGTNLLTGKVGGYQLWTKAEGRPFVINYRNNSVQNMRVAVKVVAHTGFWAPDVNDDDYVIDFTEGDYSNTFRVFSAAYKKLDGTTPSSEKYINGDYAPENVALYPTMYSAVVNPHGYTVTVPLNV